MEVDRGLCRRGYPVYVEVVCPSFELYMRSQRLSPEGTVNIFIKQP
jgi:hypothetical protein